MSEQNFKTLILTEKPSVAQDFAKSLSVQNKKNGFFENNQYVITWAVGHLMELFEPHEYNAEWKKWDLSLLPMIPEKMSYKPIAKTKSQFEVISKLLEREDINKIVVATDAGREGELIARTIIETSTKDFESYRFWTSEALTSEVVLENLKNIKSLTEYDRLYNSGLARQHSDWLVGMNLSRAATKKLGDLFSVGRVQTAVLALIVDRRRERDSFVSKPFFQLKVKFENEKGNWFGTWFKKEDGEETTRFDNKDEIAKVLEKINLKNGVVASVKKQKKKEAPPSLYSLTDLQRDANVKYAYSAQETLDIAQSLYEKHKCLSYPRSDSKVLGKKNVDLAKNLVTKLSKVYADIFSSVDQNLIKDTNKKVFNDAKLTDHHAIIPFAKIPDSASESERKIYHLVLLRFASVFCKDCEFESTEIITKIEDESFRTRGKVILSQGWREVYKDLNAKSENQKQDIQEDAGLSSDDEDLSEEEGKKEKKEDEDFSELPSLQKNDIANQKESLYEEKKTTPQSEYTEATLLKDMSNPAKYIEEEDLKKIYRGDVGLGTQATRANIIETLIQRKYVERRKKNLIATLKGCSLIDVLRTFTYSQALATPKETALWEQKLNQIAYGDGEKNKFIEEIKNFIKNCIHEFKTKSVPKVPLGECPICKSPVIEGQRGYGCSNWKSGCKFVIWKNIDNFYIPRQTFSKMLLDLKATLEVRKKNPDGTFNTACFSVKEENNTYTGIITINENNK